jgi:hypothetical protein
MNTKFIIGMVLSASMLTACSGNKGSQMEKFTINSTTIVNDGSLSSSEKAEKLALAAEQLMSPTSFMYADEVASTALSIDPSNPRAKLVRGLLGPIMTSQGVLSRIKPIMSKTKESQKAYAEIVADSANWPNSGLKTFLFNGKEDITSVSDVQKYLAQSERAYENLRNVLKDLRDTTLTINIPDQWQASEIERKAKHCEAQKLGEGIYEVECDLSGALQYKMNIADFESLRHITAGLEIYQSVLNAYSYEGSIEVSEQFKGQTPKSSTVYRALLQNPAFGKLRSEHSLRKVIDMGLDGVAGVRWVQANQNTLCPKGDNQINRPGYVFERGICIDDDNKKVSENETLGSVLRTIELALRGGTIVETFKNDWTGQKVVSELKPAAFFSEPILDVRNLGAIQFDACDNIQSIADGTLGGVFIRGDFNDVLKVTKSGCGW